MGRERWRHKASKAQETHNKGVEWIGLKAKQKGFSKQ